MKLTKKLDNNQKLIFSRCYILKCGNKAVSERGYPGPGSQGHRPDRVRQAEKENFRRDTEKDNKR